MTMNIEHQNSKPTKEAKETSSNCPYCRETALPMTRPKGIYNKDDDDNPNMQSTLISAIKLNDLAFLGRKLKLNVEPNSSTSFLDKGREIQEQNALFCIMINILSTRLPYFQLLLGVVIKIWFSKCLKLVSTLTHLMLKGTPFISCSKKTIKRWQHAYCNGSQ